MPKKRKYDINHPSVKNSLKNVYDQIDIIDPVKLKDIIRSNPSLRGMVLGYITEDVYKDFIVCNTNISKISKPDDHDRKNNKSDFMVLYKNKKTVKIQVKSMLTDTIKYNNEKHCLSASVTNDGSDKRTIVLNDGTSVNTTCYKRGEYDILAVSLYPFLGEHKFVYKLNKDCRPSTKYKRSDLLCSTEYIDTSLEGWYQNLDEVMEKV